ncbi:MAG: HU family DNA-binding protein [Acidimicrobiales bacterium]
MASSRKQGGQVNRSELIDAVAEKAGFDRRQATAAVSAFVDAIMMQTTSGEQVSIYGFGVFRPTARAARVGRNPRTSQAVAIPASNGVRFQPSAAFRAALNPDGSAPVVATRPRRASASGASRPSSAAMTEAPAKHHDDKKSKSGKGAKAKSGKKH